MALSPRKMREREARKEEILQAAREVFAEKGFLAATMEEIAQRAGFSKGAIYFYFRSKEEILLQINCALIDAFRSHLRSLTEGEAPLEGVVASLLENLRTIFREFLSQVDTLVYLSPGAQPLNVSEELSDRWYEGITDILRTLQGLLERAPGAASLAHPDSSQYALFILAMGLGVFHLTKIRHERLGAEIDPEALFDILGEVITRGLLTPRPG